VANARVKSSRRTWRPREGGCASGGRAHGWPEEKWLPPAWLGLEPGAPTACLAHGIGACRINVDLPRLRWRRRPSPARRRPSLAWRRPSPPSTRADYDTGHTSTSHRHGGNGSAAIGTESGSTSTTTEMCGMQSAMGCPRPHSERCEMGIRSRLRNGARRAAVQPEEGQPPPCPSFPTPRRRSKRSIWSR
jgi:hypothetical protein